MPPELLNPDVREALQKRDIDDLRREVVEGFRETHDLQRTTNGRLLKAEANITELEKVNIRRGVERKYEKLIWWLCTAAIGAVVGLASYIIYTK